MKLNTDILKTLGKRELRAYAKALDTYVSTRPAHIHGLCCWLRHTPGIECPYDVIAELLGASTYVTTQQGPTPGRVALAAAFAWAIAAELKRREQPKAPRKPSINLKKASLQRIFEFGLRHIRAQGRPAISGSAGACRMRTGGDMCVVGSMIADEMAQRCDEGCVSSTPVKTEPEWFTLIGGRNGAKYGLLEKMQGAHDEAAHDEEFMASFEARMSNVALSMGLTYTLPGATLRT